MTNDNNLEETNTNNENKKIPIMIKKIMIENTNNDKENTNNVKENSKNDKI